MRCTILTTIALVLLAVSCREERQYVPIRFIESDMVYDIIESNDSLYFSTASEGIFRFHRDTPQTLDLVAQLDKAPFREIAFDRTGKMFASSYTAGLYVLDSSGFKPACNEVVPAWDMDVYDQRTPWLAGDLGIYQISHDSIEQFGSARSVHDIAFWGKSIAYAHKRGLTIANRETGSIERELWRDSLFWCVDVWDSSLVAGGKNMLGILEKGKVRKVTFGPAGNICWETAKDKHGTIYLGTQEGLFACGPHDRKAICIASKGQCIKTVLLTTGGVLWAGRYEPEDESSRHELNKHSSKLE